MKIKLFLSASCITSDTVLLTITTLLNVTDLVLMQVVRAMRNDLQFG